MSNIEAFRGTVVETGRDNSTPVKWDFISTFSHKHGATVGESLGPEAIAGHLIGENGEGVKVDHFDMQLDPLEKIMSNVSAHKPDVLGISVKIGALEQTDKIITAINAIPWEDGHRPLLVLGGVVPTFATVDLSRRYPQTVLATGEAEVASQMIVEAIRGDRSFEEIPGIAFINSVGKIVATYHRLWPQSKLHLAARIATKRIYDELKGMIWAEDSRGCDFSCTFCSRRAFRGSGFSGDMWPKRIVDDFEELNNMGIHQVSFTGDDFGGDPERTFRIADEIIQRGIQMEWSVSTRADHIFERKNTPEQNARLREIMKHCTEAGLTRVFLGLESGSQSQLKRYGKQITVEENYKAIKVLRELGIDVVAGYIPIDYLMTVTELRETLEFLEKTGMGLKVTNPLSVLRVQSGSPYLKLMEHEGLLEEQTEDLVFYKAHFKDPRIELVAQLADKWVEDLYPLIFGLKGEVATVTLAKEIQNSPARNVESALHAFRRLELSFLRSLVGNLEISESIDRDAINAIQKVFVEKRVQLLEWIKSQLLAGSYGDVQTSRLFSCLNEVSQYC